MRNIAIIGANTNARVIFKFITHYGLFNVICFAVDKEYKYDDFFLDLPLIIIDDLPKYIQKDRDLVFIGVQWNRLNRDRRLLYERLKRMGFEFGNIISPNAIIHEDVILGDNIWIADYVVVETNCQIGSNSFLKASAVIGESSILGNHCFIGMRALIGGACNIKEQTFVGLGATIFDEVEIGKKCIIGASTIIKRNLPDFSLVKVNSNDQIIQSLDSKIIEEKLVAKKNLR